MEAASPRLGRVASKLLARDPRDRYGSECLLVKDLLSALRESADAPRRDIVARKAHLRRPQGEVAPVVRPPRPAARPVSEDTRTAPVVPVDPPSPELPAARPAAPPAPTAAQAEPLDDPDATSVELRLPTPARWNPRAVSFRSSHDLVEAVIDDGGGEDDTITTPRGPPPGGPGGALDDGPRIAEEEAPVRARMIPDWVAAWALVMLLAVGLWAIVTRIF